MTTSARLRATLVEQFGANGVPVERAWRDAALAVPRELFVDSYFAAVPESMPTAYRTVRRGDPGWLEEIYADRTLITQLDGTTSPGAGGDDDWRVIGSPTSSSTLPSLVLDMWQQLGVEPGHHVLEIGTGTGYSTALGAHRLGDAAVTSIEFDPVVAEQAAAALKAAGFAPRLLVGDGLRGDPHGGSYDRLIATCSVRHLPIPWLFQVKPGGGSWSPSADGAMRQGWHCSLSPSRGGPPGAFCPATRAS